MTEKTSYAPGTPCWIDLGTPDQDAAADFYGGLFGWEVIEDENAEQTGGYRVGTLNGKAVGGVMKLMQEGQPPAWLTYISVEDVDATVAKAREAGGEVIVEPMTVLDYGRMAILKDPTGAVIGIWQPGTNIGAQLVMEQGAMGWNELNTRDPEAAKAFYAAVFGWSFEEREFEGAGTYTMISTGPGEDAFGGMGEMGDQVPDLAHWLIYFMVEDADASAARVSELGGSVAVGPEDITGVGRFAVVEDPFGAVFAVFQPFPQESAVD